MFIMLITTCVIAKDIKTFNHDELLSEYERSDEEYQKYVNEGLPYRIKYQDYNTGKITFEYFNCDASEYENETVAKTKSTKKKSSKKNKKKVEVENNVSSSIDNEKMKYLESIRNQNDEEKNVGWVEFNGAWYYQDESGNNKSGWQYIGDKWYYFDPETFIMVTGLKEIDGKKYYFEPDGHMFKDGLTITIDGKLYGCYMDTGSLTELKSNPFLNNGSSSLGSSNSNNSGSYSSSLNNQAKDVIRSTYTGTFGNVLFSFHSQCMDLQVQMTNASIKSGYAYALESMARSGLSTAQSLVPVNSKDAGEIAFAISAFNNYIKQAQQNK